MNILRNPNIMYLVYLLFITTAFAGGEWQQKNITPWPKLVVSPSGFARYTSVATVEQRAEWVRQQGLVHPFGEQTPAQKYKFVAAEPELKNLVGRKIEPIMQSGLFPPEANAMATFYQKISGDTQQPRSLIFHISYKINGYRIAINGGVASMKVESIRVFIGRVNEYPVAEEVFKIAPTTLTQENIRVREGTTKEERLKAETIELKGLAAEFRDLK